jgi:zinc transport system substrate-binding protein
LSGYSALKNCIFSLLIFSVFSGCGGKTVSQRTDLPVLALSILPQTYFAERIAGNHIRTVCMVGPGQNPHSYEPTPRQMGELAAAGAWVLSGSEFEIGLRPKVEALFADLAIIDGTEGVRFRTLEAHDDDDDNEKHEEEGGIDRHTWLGEEPAKIMAEKIRDACVAMDGDRASVYHANCAALIADIETEFSRLRTELAPLRDRTVFVYHPAFGYFLDEFGMRQEAVETGGKEPTPRELTGLIEKARNEGAAAIFVQAQFPVRTAQTVAAAAGAAVIALDPLAAEWLSNIRVMGNALKTALTAETFKGEK